MTSATLYDIAGVTPLTPPDQIAAALAARLASAADDERDRLLHAQRILLDPVSRQSYDRLHSLRGPLTTAEIAATLQATGREVVVEPPPVSQPSPFAKFLFALYALLFGLVISLWLLGLLLALPLLTPEIAPILTLYGWGREAPWFVAAFVTIVCGVLGWFTLNLYEKTLHAMGRFLLVCVLVAALLVLVVQTLTDPRYGSIGVLAAVIPALSLAIALIRLVGQRDLTRIAKAPDPILRRK